MSDDVFHEAKRGHVADHVFEELASAILRGGLVPGSAVPPERVLSERFGVSRIIARQAMHRLAELGLVRVKQGGATVVLDPHDATDLRVLALFYRFAPTDPGGRAAVADMIEKQYLQGMSIVEVASRRASAGELVGIASMIDETASKARAEHVDLAAFEEQFWRGLAAAAKNRVFRMEVAWWYEVLKARPVPAPVARAPVAVRLKFYRELVRRLAAGEDPVQFYLASIRPILETVHGGAAKPRGGRATRAVKRRH